MKPYVKPICDFLVFQELMQDPMSGPLVSSIVEPNAAPRR